MDAASAAAREKLFGSPQHDENDPTRRVWITDFGARPIDLSVRVWKALALAA
jgi:hypothetical protein